MQSFINKIASGLILGSFSIANITPFTIPIGTDIADEPPSTKPLEAEQVQVTLGELHQDQQDEVLWLARVLYSETKRPEEMQLVGWVVRNRVETGFRGTNYYEVATSPGQFSGLNPTDPEYTNNVSLSRHDMSNTSWVQAIAIASAVYNAPDNARPLPKTVLHFYSPHALVSPPEWAENGELYLAVASGINGQDRFHFYENVK